MKRQTSAFALSLILVALALSGCANAVSSAPAAQAGLVPVTITVPSLSSALQGVFSAPATGSRALMFLTEYSISAYDRDTGYTIYKDALKPQSSQSGTVTQGQNGPGNIGDPYTMNLMAGHSYDFSVYGYNDVEQYGSVVSGTLYNRYINKDSQNDIYITLTPTSPDYAYSSVGDSMTQYQVQQSTLDPQTHNLSSMGGERWIQYTPTDSTFSVTITPSGSDLVYASLYDAEGYTLAGGLSPSFGGTTAVNAFTISSGVAAYQPVYLGFIVVSTTGTAGYSDVVLTVATPTLTDDAFDQGNGNDSLATAATVEGPSSTKPTVTMPTLAGTSLLAYDQDWWQFYASAPGTYTVTVTCTDSAFPNGFTGNVSLSTPNGLVNAWDTSWTQTTSSKSVFTTSIKVTSSDIGFCTLDVDLHGADPVNKFPIVGGKYKFTISYAP